MAKPKIYDQDIQAVLREVFYTSNCATYERNPLGGNDKYVYVNGDILRELLLEKDHSRYLHLKCTRREWWSNNLDEARELAKKLHIPGPNIKDVAPILTPDIAEIRTVEYYAYNSDFEKILEEILDYLVDGGYINRHPDNPSRYKINGPGAAHLIKAPSGGL
jgi:hypothetical protein